MVATPSTSTRSRSWDDTGPGAATRSTGDSSRSRERSIAVSDTPLSRTDGSAAMTSSAPTSAALRRRRWLAGGATALLPFALVAGFGHAGQHMARSVLVPGAGLYDERPMVGVALTALAVAATVAWVRWGVDWAVAVAVVVAVAVSGLLGGTAHDPSRSA